jgi:hypothetical protein
MRWPDNVVVVRRCMWHYSFYCMIEWAIEYTVACVFTLRPHNVVHVVSHCVQPDFPQNFRDPPCGPCSPSNFRDTISSTIHRRMRFVGRSRVLFRLLRSHDGFNHHCCRHLQVGRWRVSYVPAIEFVLALVSPGTTSRSWQHLWPTVVLLHLFEITSFFLSSNYINNQIWEGR